MKNKIISPLNPIEYSRVVGLIPEDQLTDKEKYYRKGMNKEIKKMLKIKKRIK